MHALLEFARPDELPDLLRSVTVLELTTMDERGADQWRRRILALIESHRLGDRGRQVRER